MRCDLVPSGGADMVLSMEPLESLRYLSYLKPAGRIVTAAEPFVNIPDYPELGSILEAIRKPAGQPRRRGRRARQEGGLGAGGQHGHGRGREPLHPRRPRSGIEASIARLFGAKERLDGRGQPARPSPQAPRRPPRARRRGRDSSMATRYWDEAAETMGRGPRSRRCSSRGCRATVGRALRTPFYEPRLEAVGIVERRGHPEPRRPPAHPLHDQGRPARGLSPTACSPPTAGTSCACTPPRAPRARPRSSTSRAPTSTRWTDYIARSIAATGADSSDVFQNMMTYGLFTGGLGMHYGAERVGMMVIPAGPGNTARQLKLMRDFGTTTVHATPSFLLHLHSKMAEEGVAPGDLKLKRAFCGAEPYSEDTRRKIESLFGIDVYNSYGLSEMNGPGVAFECEQRDGMHVWEDGYILEVIDPDTPRARARRRAGRARAHHPLPRGHAHPALPDPRPLLGDTRAPAPAAARTAASRASRAAPTTCSSSTASTSSPPRSRR